MPSNIQRCIINYSRTQYRGCIFAVGRFERSEPDIVPLVVPNNLQLADVFFALCS